MDQLAGEQLEDIVEGIKKTVYSILKKHGITGEYFREECLQAGLLGAVKALKNFDETRGVKFISFARLYIKGEVYQALNDISKGEIPKTPDITDKSGIDVEFFFENTAERLVAQKHNVSVKNLYCLLSSDFPSNSKKENNKDIVYESFNTTEDTSNSSRKEAERKVEARKNEVEQEKENLARLMTYLNEFHSVDEEYKLSYTEEHLIKKEKHKMLNDCVEKLPEKEKIIIYEYYYEDEEVKNIANYINVTKARICQLRNVALQRINTCLEHMMG